MRRSALSGCCSIQVKQNDSCKRRLISISSKTGNREFRNIFEQCARKKGIVSTDGWYRSNPTTVLNDKGLNILTKYFHGSLYNALSSLFPEESWYPWKFQSQKVPSGYWDQVANQRKFFDELGVRTGVKSMDDWYSVLNQKLLLENGGWFINKYHGSAIEAIKAAYPEHNWIPWKFASTSQGFWKSIENQRQFFDWLGKELGVNQLDDWYQVLDTKTVVKHGGSFVHTIYNSSVIEALKVSFPNHNWLPWKFKSTSQGYWKSVSHQRQFFDWLGSNIGVKELDDWYEKLNCKTVLANGGSFVIHLYGGSAMEALKASYPEHSWDIWKFREHETPRGFWNSQENVSRFVNDLSDKLCIRTLDDWYRVDQLLLQKFGASKYLIKKYGSLHQLLSQVYPEHLWDSSKFKTQKKAQRWLLVSLQNIFPNEKILEDYIHPKIITNSKQNMQLDVFIPSLSLAFEYQGQHHFKDIHVFGPQSRFVQRDLEKNLLCQETNITLVEIPYWWDRTSISLQQMINKSKNSI